MKEQELHSNSCYCLFLNEAIKSKFWLILLSFPLIISGCIDSKYSQCERVFNIAQSVVKINHELDLGDRQGLAEIETKNWLSAANIMNQAADKLMTLKIDQIELVDYRQKLATVYIIYAQATHDAIKSNEDRNLEALHAARNDAAKAGEMQRKLVRDINAFCTSN